MTQQLPPHLHPDNLALRVSYCVGEFWQDEIQFVIGKDRDFKYAVYLSMEANPENARLSRVGRYCTNPVGGMGDIKSGDDLRRGKDIADYLNDIFSNVKEAVADHNLTQVGVPVKGKNQIAQYFSFCSKKLYERIAEMIQDF